jgi:adenylate cyclase
MGANRGGRFDRGLHTFARWSKNPREFIITYLSVVHRIDSSHVGLSNQFLNKTWENIQENPRAQIIVCRPETGEQFRLDLQYERTVSEGAIFDSTKTRLDAVASQTGLTHVFRLRGVDIYAVLDCRPTASSSTTPEDETSNTDEVQALDAVTEQLSVSGDLDSFLDVTLTALSNLFGYDHSFLMVPDEQQHRLFTIASHGFEKSGIGSEIHVGEGIIGIAAQQRTIVRIASMARDVAYSRAVRSGVERGGSGGALEREIALPGLQDSQSTLAVPLLVQDELLGVLCLQSTIAGRFRASDERLMRIAARHVAARMALLRTLERTSPPAGAQISPRALLRATARVSSAISDLTTQSSSTTRI